MKTIQELEKMTDDELRVMLAELAGWKKETRKRYAGESSRKGWGLNTHLPLGDANRHFTTTHLMLPNYPADLNACHAAEINLSDEQGNAYINTIADSIDPMGEMGWKLDLAVCRATARQRTIALILTLQA